MLKLERVPGEFSVCKVADYSLCDLSRPFHFVGSTDRERSLVCPVECVPENALARDDGWRALRVAGQLDFSLVGVLARISEVLAGANVGIFAISTYDTDYILTKSENFERALSALSAAGYEID